MYQQAQTKQLQQKTIEWLALAKEAKASAVVAGAVEELRDILRFHEYRYYVQNDPLMHALVESIEKADGHIDRINCSADSAEPAIYKVSQ